MALSLTNRTILSAFIFLGLFMSAYAKNNTSKDEKNLLTVSRTLHPDFALKVAKAALLNCRKGGYQVTVVVVDNGGNIQVTLRDQLAGILTPKAAFLKAQTAISFRTNTSTLTTDAISSKRNAEIRNLPGILLLGGGVTIKAGGSTIGAVGVSGAPSGKIDEKCAEAGIATIKESLDFL